MSHAFCPDNGILRVISIGLFQVSTKCMDHHVDQKETTVTAVFNHQSVALVNGSSLGISIRPSKLFPLVSLATTPTGKSASIFFVDHDDCWINGTSILPWLLTVFIFFVPTYVPTGTSLRDHSVSLYHLMVNAVIIFSLLLVSEGIFTISSSSASAFVTKAAIALVIVVALRFLAFTLHSRHQANAPVSVAQVPAV